MSYGNTEVSFILVIEVVSVTSFLVNGVKDLGYLGQSLESLRFQGKRL